MSDPLHDSAGDGHLIAAASHDKGAPRKSPGKAKVPGRTAAFTATKYATGHPTSTPQ